MKDSNFDIFFIVTLMLVLILRSTFYMHPIYIQFFILGEMEVDGILFSYMG